MANTTLSAASYSKLPIYLPALVRRSQWSVAADWALMATLSYASLPLAITLGFRVSGVPLLNGFYLGTMVVVALAYMAVPKGRTSMIWPYITAGLCMVIVSFLYLDSPQFDSRAALQDVTAFAGLPIGIAIAVLNDADGLYRLLKKCYLIVSVLFAANIALIYTGLLQSGGGITRQLDGAMYTSDFFIAVSFPCLWSRVRQGGGKARLVAIFGLVLCAVFSITSATRSVLLTLLLSLACAAIVEIKRRSVNLVWIGIAIGALLTVLVAVGMPLVRSFQTTQVAERLSATDVQNEDRFEELRSMVNQMGTAEWIHGAGFGTQFFSDIPETGLAIAPHIGLGALLFKGGLPALCILMLLPCFVALSKLFTAKSSPADAFLAGVAVYFFQSCLSGGWAFVPLLTLGIFLQAGVGRRVFSRRKLVPPGGRVVFVARPINGTE